LLIITPRLMAGRIEPLSIGRISSRVDPGAQAAPSQWAWPAPVRTTTEASDWLSQVARSSVRLAGWAGSMLCLGRHLDFGPDVRALPFAEAPAIGLPVEDEAPPVGERIAKDRVMNGARSD
jgi:hypothetical protein